MKKVPVMISTKDLSYLADIFSWNFTASKTCNHFKVEMEEEALKEKMKQLAKMHAKICNKIIEILS